MLFLAFSRLRTICCLLFKNGGHISNVWPFSMCREDLIHLLYRHETNDMITVNFCESPIKWIITISSRFCQSILFIITYIFPSDSLSVFSYEIRTIRIMPMIMFIYGNNLKPKVGELWSTKMIACELNRLNQGFARLFSLDLVVRCEHHLLIDDRVKNG